MYVVKPSTATHQSHNTNNAPRPPDGVLGLIEFNRLDSPELLPVEPGDGLSRCPVHIYRMDTAMAYVSKTRVWVYVECFCEVDPGAGAGRALV